MRELNRSQIDRMVVSAFTHLDDQYTSKLLLESNDQFLTNTLIFLRACDHFEMDATQSDLDVLNILKYYPDLNRDGRQVENLSCLNEEHIRIARQIYRDHLDIIKNVGRLNTLAQSTPIPPPSTLPDMGPYPKRSRRGTSTRTAHWFYTREQASLPDAGDVMRAFELALQLRSPYLTDHQNPGRQPSEINFIHTQLRNESCTIAERCVEEVWHIVTSKEWRRHILWRYHSDTEMLTEMLTLCFYVKTLLDMHQDWGEQDIRECIERSMNSIPASSRTKIQRDGFVVALVQKLQKSHRHVSFPGYLQPAPPLTPAYVPQAPLPGPPYGGFFTPAFSAGVLTPRSPANAPIPATVRPGQVPHPVDLASTAVAAPSADELPTRDAIAAMPVKITLGVLKALMFFASPPQFPLPEHYVRSAAAYLYGREGLSKEEKTLPREQLKIALCVMKRVSRYRRWRFEEDDGSLALLAFRLHLEDLLRCSIDDSVDCMIRNHIGSMLSDSEHSKRRSLLSSSVNKWYNNYRKAFPIQRNRPAEKGA
ncbi:MAG: hypothetical protein AAF355_04160 [Myxococcota bacterium]